MAKSNKQIVQTFFDEVFNGGHYEKVEEYFSKDCPSIFMPHIGLGFQADWTKDKVKVEYIIPNGPCQGKLAASDEIVRIEEEGTVFDTFESMRDGAWGLGPLGTLTKMRVKRNNKLVDLELNADQIKWSVMPYTVEQQKRDFMSLPNDWKDIDFSIQSMVEEDDQVVCITSVSATSLIFKQHAFWGIIWVFKFRDGKINSLWSLGDSLVYFKQVGYQILPPDKK